MVATFPKFPVFSFQFSAASENMETLWKSRSLRDLIAWQKALDLAKNIYRLTRQFPKEETYGLTQQARRAAVSIPANIAEGQGRNGVKEFIQFLGIANGSLAELKTYLYLAAKLKFAPIPELKSLSLDCDEVARLVYALRQSLLKTENSKLKTSPRK